MSSQLRRRQTTQPHSRERRTGHICHACGALFAARAGDHLGAIFCPGCLDRPDDPVTAEHYWDLGGGD
ncbi:MAG: hypothetical protein HS111_07885 [Kofleriaceae bacterium]|nr:hypothetical protein [Kofleriaceae bacterium]MCL4224712.1 hypothetical protein [Myxococcales bacterium]